MSEKKKEAKGKEPVGETPLVSSSSKKKSSASLAAAAAASSSGSNAAAPVSAPVKDASKKPNVASSSSSAAVVNASASAAPADGASTGRPSARPSFRSTRPGSGLIRPGSGLGRPGSGKGSAKTSAKAKALVEEETMDSIIKKELQLCLAKRTPQLSFKGFNLEICPRSLGSLAHISELNLSTNFLQNLPTELSMLPHLRSLNLEHNLLPMLPLAITSLPTLVSLNISHNRIKELPDGLTRLASLRVLDAGSNEIEVVHPWLATLGTLNTLSLRENKLQDLPMEMGRMTQLKSLDISLNPFKSPLNVLVKDGFHAVLNHLRKNTKRNVQQLGMNLGFNAANSAAVSESDFESIKFRLQEESFPDFKLEVMQKATFGHLFTSEQVRELVEMEQHSSTKVNIAMSLHPMIVDPSRFYRVLDALPFVSDREMVSVKVGASGEDADIKFDPNNPAGYYMLNMGNKKHKAVAERLRDLEMKNEGENLKMVRLDGKPYQILNEDDFERLEPRCETGYFIRLLPEMVEFSEPLTVYWKAPQVRESRLGDFIGLYRPGDADSTPPLGSGTWDDVDKQFPTLRVSVSGRIRGNASLQVITFGDSSIPVEKLSGVFEARYIIDDAVDAAGDKKYKCMAKSNTIFVGARDKPIKKSLPRSGMLEMVYIAHDDAAAAAEQISNLAKGISLNEKISAASSGLQLPDAAPPPVCMDDTEFLSLRQRMEDEPFMENKILVLQNALASGYFNAAQAHTVLTDLADSYSDDPELMNKVMLTTTVALYARGTENAKFLQVLKAVPSKDIRAEVCEILEIDSEERVKVMTDSQVDALIGKAREERQDSKRLAVVRKGLGDTQLRCNQLVKLLENVCQSMEVKIDMAISLFTSVIDPENAPMVLEVFASDPDSQEAVKSAIVV